MELSESKLLFYKELKKFKNIMLDLVPRCDVNIENSENSRSIPMNRVINMKNSTGVFVELNISRFIQWINGAKTESFDTPFIFRKGCIVYGGNIRVSQCTVDLRFDIPRVYRTNIPMSHVFDGFVSLRITKGGLMNISEKHPKMFPRLL